MKKFNSNPNHSSLANLREQAEELLPKKEPPEVEINSIEDAQRLITELQVHQIELELQNDELRKMQEQIISEREKYADLYNFAPVAYFTFDEQDIILDLNLTAAELLGNERKYLIGHPLSPYLTSDSLQTFIKHRQLALETKRPRVCELSIRLRHGRKTYVQVRTAALETSPDMPQLWRSVMTDITDRKHQEQKANYQAYLLDNVSDAIIATDNDLRITQWNKSAENLYGWSEAEVLGKLIDSVCGTEFPADVQEQAKSQLMAQKFWQGELRQQKRDGVKLWVIASVSQLQDEQGRIIGGVTINHNITERKRAGEALAKSEEKLNSILNSMLDGVYSVDAKTFDLIQTNPSVAHIFGRSQEDIQSAGGRAYLQFVHPEDLQIVKQIAKDLVQQGQGEWEFRIVRPSGEVRWVTNRARFITDGQGTPLRFDSLFTDITTRKREDNILQARLRIMKFAETHSVDELLQNALDELCVLSESVIGFFHFVETDQKTLSLQAWSTRTLAGMCTAEGKGTHYDIDKAGVWVDCVREGKPVIHNDYASLPHRKGLPEGHAPVIREMVFPIFRSQKMVGIIGVGNKPSDYTEEDVSHSSRLADLIWDIAERRIAEEELRRANDALNAQMQEIELLHATLREQAIRDPLTGLFNRRFLQETLDREISRAHREGKPIGFIIMDLDYFKQVNDTYGHKAGDMVLKKLGDLLIRNLRAEDIPCRYGGEEFTIMMPGASLENTLERAKNLLCQINEMEIVYDNAKIKITASMGVSVFPDHGTGEEDALICADRALYQAKGLGRNRVFVYED
jgi:diguanylate cyclase (GGDEF)-like protein/PAS domain S-box-containing protein